MNVYDAAAADDDDDDDSKMNIFLYFYCSFDFGCVEHMQVSVSVRSQ